MKKIFTRKALLGFVALAGISVANAQQVIGSYPAMDGGFEGQATGSLTAVPSIAAADTRTDWTVQGGTPANTGTILGTGGRSGSKYVSFQITATGPHRRLQSPTVTGINASTTYQVQFFYKNNGGTLLDIRGGASQSGTGSGTYAPYVANANVGSTWTKYTGSVALGGTTAANGIGIVSVLADEVGGFDIDDFVLYQAATADVTAPDPVTGGSAMNPTTNSLDVSWAAPGTGVDGGGYVVVRFNTTPGVNDDPNQNGIYVVGNTVPGTVTGEVVYVGTGTSFTNTGLSNGSTYYYKVYTVDKAFNYSAETIISGSTSAFPVSLLSFNAALNNKVVNLDWSTANEVNAGSFELERSVNGKDFIRISSVSAKNAMLNNYNFVDEKAVAGTNYYRLKIVDKDGSYKYSQIVSVKAKSEGVGVFPNPVKGNFTVQHEAAIKGATISVIDFAGKQVAAVNVQAGATQTNLDASRFTPGTYMIVFNNDGVKLTKQFVKQ